MKLAWQQIPSPVVSDILCLGPLDGVVIDTEHAAYNNETLYSCIQVITAQNKTCFVRLTEVNKTMIRMCLDAGANGIIFSTVETTEECELIQKYCKFPLYGGKRGLGLVRENKWGYNELITQPPIIIAQIETAAGIANLENILSYNFDFYMIGPYDLSASLGFPADFENSAYLEAIEKVSSQVPPHKMAVHIPTDVKNQIKKYKNYGMIAIGMDTTGLLEFYKETTQYVKF
jgi:2-dehydro-3-deoxyglucarate aldolase